MTAVHDNSRKARPSRLAPDLSAARRNHLDVLVFGVDLACLNTFKLDHYPLVTLFFGPSESSKVESIDGEGSTKLQAGGGGLGTVDKLKALEK